MIGIDIGVIIKYYRKQRGWTQRDLGNGICSEAHLGKVEKGTTKFSTDTIDLLCERLGIKKEEEIKRFHYLQNQLNELDRKIVKLQLDTDMIENKLNELANNPIIYMDVFRPFFILIQCRYALEIRDMDIFNKMMKEFNENYPNLQKFEWYMKEHILGINKYQEQKYHKALEHLMRVETSEYPNHEIYFHIAGALLFQNNQVKAFFYVNKALDYFKQTNNFNKIIDTETLLLILIQDNEVYSFDDIIHKYRELIQMCDSYQTPEKKWVLLNNLAFTYFINKKFERAQAVFGKAKALSLTLDNKNYFLSAQLGQIHSRLWQSKPFTGKEKEEWLNLIGESISLSKNDKFFKNNCHLLTLLMKGEKQLYYESLYKDLIPYLKENGEYFTARFYAKEAYQYFLAKERKDIAAQIAMSMME